MSKHHKYYSEDSEQRKRYFDKQFLKNAKIEARNNNMPLSSFLSKIQDFGSFKKVLKDSWDNDASLSTYYGGMGDSELLEFFERPTIQNVLNQDLELVVEKVPIKVIQEDKKTKEFFRGLIRSVKLDREQRVMVLKEKVKVKGKMQTRYRDSRGRFAKLLK